MKIGERIQKRRKELGMSVEELSNRIGKNRSTVYRYEKGNIESLPADILEVLSQALETTPQYLLGLVSTETINTGLLDGKTKGWYEEFGHHDFADEEHQKLVEFARFLVWHRERNL